MGFPLYLANRGNPCSALSSPGGQRQSGPPREEDGNPDIPDSAGPQYVAFRSLT